MERWRELGYVPDSQEEEEAEEEEDLEALLLNSPVDELRAKTIGQIVRTDKKPDAHTSDEDDIVEQGHQKPTATPKYGRKRRKSGLPRGENNTTLQRPKRWRHQMATGLEQTRCEPEQLQPIEPESSPDVLQSDDVLSRPMLVRPSRDWKEALPHHDDDDDALSTLSTMSSSLSTVLSFPTLQEPFHTAEERSQPIEATIERGHSPGSSINGENHVHHGIQEEPYPSSDKRDNAASSNKSPSIQNQNLPSDHNLSQHLDEPSGDTRSASPGALISQKSESRHTPSFHEEPRREERHSPPRYHGRALRPRTVLQERPYQVELARYALFCRQQGIPFHMPKSREHLREQQRQNGHQMEDFEDGSAGAEESQEYLDVVGRSGADMVEDEESQVVNDDGTTARKTARRHLSRPSGLLRGSLNIASRNSAEIPTDKLHAVIFKKRKTSHSLLRLHTPSKDVRQIQRRRILSLSDSEDDSLPSRNENSTQRVDHGQSLVNLLNIPEVPSSPLEPGQATGKPQEKSMIALLDELEKDELFTFEGDQMSRQHRPASTQPPSERWSHLYQSRDIVELSDQSGIGAAAPLNNKVQETLIVSDDGSDTNSNADSDASSTSTSVQSSSSGDTPGSRELQKLQKRIKGVLPASWIRLEMKLQQEKEKTKRREERRRREAASGGRRGARTDGKGVAHVISRERRGSAPSRASKEDDQPRRRFAPDFLEDDAIHNGSSSGEEVAGRDPTILDSPIRPVDDTSGQLVLSEWSLGDGDIPEDNRIDRMIPSHSRRVGYSAPASGRLKRRKQARLNFDAAQTPILSLHVPPVAANSISSPLWHAVGAYKRNPSATQFSIGKGAELTRKRMADIGADASWIQTTPREFLRSESSKSFKTAGKLPAALSSDTFAHTTSTHQQRTKLRQSRLEGLGNVGAFRSKPLGSVPGPRQLRRSASDCSAFAVANVTPAGSAPAGIDSNPKGQTKRPGHEKHRTFGHTVRRDYVLTSGRREALRPAGLENVTLPTPLERGTLKRVESMKGPEGIINQATNWSGSKCLRLPTSAPANPQLERYLYGDENDDFIWAAHLHDNHDLASGRHEQHHRRTHKQRKLRQNGVDNTGATSGDAVKRVDQRNPTLEQPVMTHCQLKGLEMLDTFPTIDFGITYLSTDAYFYSSTFIGSGEFSRAIRVDDRPLDKENGTTTIHHKGLIYRWGGWTESVASELTDIFRDIRQVLDEHCEAGHMAPDKDRTNCAVDLYRAVIAYVTDNLFFIDYIDRKSFVNRCIHILNENLELRGSSSQVRGPHDCTVLCRTMDLVFAAQVHKVAAADLTLAGDDLNAKAQLKRAAELVLGLIVTESGKNDLQSILKQDSITSLREKGISDDHPFVSALAILTALERDIEWLAKDLRESRRLLWMSMMTDHSNLLELERGWFILFAMLPFDKFDEFGILKPDYRKRGGPDQWPIVADLLTPVLGAYEHNIVIRPLDRYCRTLFCRCFHLITYWKWQNWQDILQHLFRFFSRRRLRNLPSEGLCGSPPFLTQLENNPALEIEDRDSCFHIFLKAIGVSWHCMGKVYDKQKLHNFARRLIPLHERRYPKDEPLNQQDLDELRNHHDLLSTLYWAIPEEFRFRVATIRWLVQPLDSHTEASVISINSWLRLVRYKLSTDEDISGLEPFADWHSSFTKDMLKLHSLARTEIEAQARDNHQYSRELLLSVIDENQKHIEALLGTALINMKLALQNSSTVDHAKALFDKFPLAEVLDRFYGSNSRSGIVVCQVLDTVLAFTASEPRRSVSQRKAPILIDINEESQEEYGDWSAFAELSNEELMTPGPGIHFLDGTIRPLIQRLTSRSFGDDSPPSDQLLHRVVDCYVSVAAVLVRYGLRQWSTYLNEYSPDAWTSLPWTDQTRRLTPCVLAQLIEADGTVYAQCKQEILKQWLSCIVERGSNLKHQHLLTSALLNVDESSPLLTNLPFSKTTSERYAITLEEFNQRRLSMISSILSNIREHVANLQHAKSPEVQRVSDFYRESIETLMRAMKSSYQELGAGKQHAQSQYVTFVQSVVGYLQQHVQQLCPLDPFFTDPKAFPLPADDPSYIAAKLLSYEVRLSDEKVGKQLVTFIQSVSERAAADGQQTYFADQLYSATIQSMERRRKGSHGLGMLDIIVACVLPGYMEVSFKDPVAWILIRPFLQSLGRTFQDLILYLNIYDQRSVDFTVWTLSLYFFKLDETLRLLVDHPGLLEESRILLVVISYLETVVASLPVIDYLARSTCDVRSLVSSVGVFRQMALFAKSCLVDPATAWAPDTLNMNDLQPHINPEFLLRLHKFATNELKSWLRDTWSHREERYYVRQGLSWKEVALEPSSLSMDIIKPAFIQTITTLCFNVSHYDTFNTHFKIDEEE
ncbi:hypothetical protein KEM54_000756 [Ascosphaera aggregata]|nr:hypothetical protein KEM54_000756 [Ascosphaera aggregata]